MHLYYFSFPHLSTHNLTIYEQLKGLFLEKQTTLTLSVHLVHAPSFFCGIPYLRLFLYTFLFWLFSCSLLCVSVFPVWSFFLVFFVYFCLNLCSLDHTILHLITHLFNRPFLEKLAQCLLCIVTKQITVSTVLSIIIKELSL